MQTLGWIGLFVGLCLIVGNYCVMRKKKQSVPRLDKTALVLVMCIIAIMLIIEFLPKMISTQESMYMMKQKAIKQNQRILKNAHSFIDLRTGVVQVIDLKNMPISERRHYKVMPIGVKHPSLITK